MLIAVSHNPLAISRKRFSTKNPIAHANIPKVGQAFEASFLHTLHQLHIVWHSIAMLSEEFLTKQNGSQTKNGPWKVSFLEFFLY